MLLKKWKCPPKSSFDKVITLLEEYKREYGDLLIPQRYCTKDGVKLGAIVKNLRYGTRKLTVEEKAKLDEIGFVWNVRAQRAKNERQAFDKVEKK